MQKSVRNTVAKNRDVKHGLFVFKMELPTTVQTVS